jgi:transposase
MERNDLSRALVAFDQNSTLVAVVELSLNDWLAAGFLAGDTTRRLKKLPADPDRLLKHLLRWREEAAKSGRAISRIVVAFEAGRDGFWLARWLRARGVEAYVIHASIAAPRLIGSTPRR